MRRPPFSIVIVLALILGLSGVPLPEDPTPDEAHTPLTSVSKRGKYVFASTPDGLFRAPLETKKWERLKTPPGMPPGGDFAGQPGPESLVFYVSHKSQPDTKPRPGARHGLYLSRDDGSTWDLVSERDDIGPAVYLPDGGLFAITGYDDPLNGGDHLLRSSDLGKTWREIPGNWGVNLLGIGPDPYHPGLVRLHGWALRGYTIFAEDANYQWKTVMSQTIVPGRRPSSEFFERESSSTNRLYLHYATLSNYFGYDFDIATSVHAFEVAPLKSKYEFAHDAKVVVPIRVVFRYDPDTLWPGSREVAAEGRPLPKSSEPTEKLADQPGGIAFWGLRVETRDDQDEKYPPGFDNNTISGVEMRDGKPVPNKSQPPPVKYQAFNLSPSTPYEREIDLGRIHDFSKAGEYRVQLIYNSGGQPEDGQDVWGGCFISPVFTIIIKE